MDDDPSTDYNARCADCRACRAHTWTAHYAQIEDAGGGFTFTEAGDVFIRPVSRKGKP